MDMEQFGPGTLLMLLVTNAGMQVI